VKPASFEYHAPTTVDEALGVLAEHGDDARVLAGGQSLVPLMAMRLSRTEHLVDLNAIEELAQIGNPNGRQAIGAMVRQRTIERDTQVEKTVPLLSRATPWIGHFQIRNRGTLGGSLAHADPAAEYPAVALALDAEIEVRSAEQTRLSQALDFFDGPFSTAIEPNELLTSVSFPVRQSREGFAIDEVARRHGDFALVGSVARVSVDDRGVVAAAAVAMFGVGATAQRMALTEQAMIGTSDDLDLAEVAQIAHSELSPPEDLHATANYRKRVGAVTVRRALKTALAEARRG
jgi:carbon-monoxide dehydrogenase medium subunit